MTATDTTPTFSTEAVMSGTARKGRICGFGRHCKGCEFLYIGRYGPVCARGGMVPILLLRRCPVPRMERCTVAAAALTIEEVEAR